MSEEERAGAGGVCGEAGGLGAWFVGGGVLGKLTRSCVNEEGGGAQ